MNNTPPNSIGKEMLLSANCLYEANNPALYVPFPYGFNLVIAHILLSPSDCLSLGCLIARSSITEVVLIECNLSPSCMRSLTQGLGSQPSCIETLGLLTCSIDEQSVAVLSDWIMTCNVRTFGLSYCDFGYNGLACILKSLKGRSVHDLHLILSNVQVNESNDFVLQDFITSTPSLETLDLSFNFQFSNIGASCIAQALRHDITLKTLNISYCGISCLEQGCYLMAYKQTPA